MPIPRASEVGSGKYSEHGNKVTPPFPWSEYFLFPTSLAHGMSGSAEKIG